MTISIVEISYEDINRVWSDKLWVGRDQIPPISAMLYLTGHDMTHFTLPVKYRGLFDGSVLVGVNSGHLCADNSYRSRGLWVDIPYRGFGYGVKLLEQVINDGKALGCSFCWSLPRKTSWPTYEKAGFTLTSGWMATETSDANAYCRIDL